MEKLRAHLNALGRALVNSAFILACQISRRRQWLLTKWSEYKLGNAVADQYFDHQATKQLASRIRDLRQRLSATQAYAAPEGQNWLGRSVHHLKLWVERVWLNLNMRRLQLRLGRLVRSELMNEAFIPAEHNKRFGELTGTITDVGAKEEALRHSTPWLLRQPLVILIIVGAIAASSTWFLGPDRLNASSMPRTPIFDLPPTSTRHSDQEHWALQLEDRKRIAQGRLPLRCEFAARGAGLTIREVEELVTRVRSQIKQNDDLVLQDDEIFYRCVFEALTYSSVAKSYFDAETVRRKGGAAGYFVLTLRAKLHNLSGRFYL